MEALARSLQKIRSRMYTLDEFPFLSRETLSKTLLPEISKLSEEDLKVRAMHLTGRQLDTLLLELKDSANPDAMQAAVAILRNRFSPRLLKLLTRLFQYNPHSPGLLLAARGMVSEANRLRLDPCEGLFLFRFAKEEDLTKALCAAVEEEGGDIDEFCRRYALDPASPLARKTFLIYLAGSAKERLLRNKAWVLQLIQEEEPEALTPLIQNYLSRFAFAEFSQNINLKIRERLGEPRESVFWMPYTAKEREIFIQWSFLYELKVHSVNYPEKYKILSNYRDQIISCKQTPDQQMLVIDFGRMVILDPSDRPYAFCCRRSHFEEEMKQCEDSAWRRLSSIEEKGEAMTSRDFIIENREDPWMKLVFEGVERLYVAEMLDIKLGLEPDTRKKTAGSGKRARVKKSERDRER